MAALAYVAGGIVVLLMARMGGYNTENRWSKDLFVVAVWPLVLLASARYL